MDFQTAIFGSHESHKSKPDSKEEKPTNATEAPSPSTSLLLAVLKRRQETVPVTRHVMMGLSVSSLATISVSFTFSFTLPGKQVLVKIALLILRYKVHSKLLAI